MGSEASEQPLRIGRYVLFREIAVGGMASVHLAQLLGPGGFTRTVAIKRMHPQYAREPEFVAMFVDEARLATRVVHPNVVPTIDVVATRGELFLVMEYVSGETLARLVRATKDAGERLAPAIVSAIVVGMLGGLHAAHEAKSARGEPLCIVHRDVSAQNVLVGADGVARVLDFGVAKAIGRIHSTRGGAVKGKLAYMAPEQIAGGKVDRRTDVYAAGVVLWESLTGERLFAGTTDAETINRVLSLGVRPPRALVPDLPPAVDRVVLRALERDPDLRFASAREMAEALAAAIAPATVNEVSAVVERLAANALAERGAWVAEVESTRTEVDAAPRTFRKRVPIFVAAALVTSVAVWAAAHRSAVPSAAASTPTSTSPPVETGAGSAAVAAAVTTSTSTSTSTFPSPSPSHPKRAPSPRKVSCDPPWTVDASGAKKWKVECR